MTNSESRTASTVREALIAARLKISVRSRWGQGARNRDRPSYTCCASEAIEETCPDFDLRCHVFSKFAKALGAGVRLSIPQWNDKPGRTHAEVLAVFDSAIEQCAVGDREGDATPQTVA